VGLSLLVFTLFFSKITVSDASRMGATRKHIMSIQGHVFRDSGKQTKDSILLYNNIYNNIGLISEGA